MFLTKLQRKEKAIVFNFKTCVLLILNIHVSAIFPQRNFDCILYLLKHTRAFWTTFYAVNKVSIIYLDIL